MGTAAMPQMKLPTAPGAAPDQTDALLKGRRQMALTLASKRGMGSTFLTTQQMGTGTLLGGTGGASGGGSS